MRKISYLFLALAFLNYSCDPQEEPIPEPVFQSLSAEQAMVQDTLTLSGENFGSDIDQLKVLVGDIEATVLQLEGTRIRFVVPAVEEGEHPVQVEVKKVLGQAGGSLKVYPRIEKFILNRNNVIPFQSLSLQAADLPGVKEDFKLTLNGKEAPIYDMEGDALHVLIPLNVAVGAQKIGIQYKDFSYPEARVTVIDWKEQNDGVSMALTAHKNFPVHVMDAEQLELLPHVNDNGRVVGSYVKSGEESAYVELNEDGTPAAYFHDNYIAVFGGYDLEQGTVNVSVFDKEDDENNYLTFDVAIPKKELDILRSQANLRVGASSVQSIGNALKAASVGVSITSCALSVASIPTGWGILLTGMTCGSSIYEAYKLVNPDEEAGLPEILMSVHGIKMGIIGCGSTLVAREPLAVSQGVLDCIGLVTDVAENVVVLVEEVKIEESSNIELQQDALSTGHGDVKVTLSWNTTADIDVWVTDPAGEKIYYDAPYSNSGGMLDVDDTDGYGPENIFWPSEGSPEGEYTVHVHYYGPEDGDPTDYRIMIYNFGESQVYTGTILYDEVHHIATFTAGGALPGGESRQSSQQRLRNIKVERTKK